MLPCDTCKTDTMLSDLFVVPFASLFHLASDLFSVKGSKDRLPGK